MGLQGLPDWNAPLQLPSGRLLYPYEAKGDLVLLPDALEIALDAHGRPELRLEAVRGQNPLLPPAPYGTLDLKVRARFPGEAAAEAAREQADGSRVGRAVFAAGFLRLQPAADAVGLPSEVRQPVPLGWNGLGIARWHMRLPPEGIAFLKRALQDATLAVLAAAEVEIAAVSPRLPLRVRFDPARLLAALLALADSERRIAWDDALSYFRRPAEQLPLTLLGDADRADRNELAEALTDRVRLRFGASAPSPHDDPVPCFSLAGADAAGGEFEWDLAQPVAAPRVLVLRLDPLGAAREAVARDGLAAICRESVVPPIPTGTLQVTVTVNLPENRVGLLAIGVEIRVPPRPPHRPQAIVRAVEIQPPDDMAVIDLRLSPAEPPDYLYKTFAMVRGAQGVRRLETAEEAHSGPRLDLSPDAFPVRFVLAEASAALLEIGPVKGSCADGGTASPAAPTFELTAGRPAVALGLPRDCDGATITIEARNAARDRVLRLGPLPLRHLHLDLPSFPEHGVHRIAVTCRFDDDRRLVAIDLLPEDQPETAETTTVLRFTPDQAQREWQWFARSPFRAGYRFRAHRNPDEAQAAWSEPRSPFEPLEIRASAMAGG